ncbi:MAG: hypothetical protein JSW47_11010 [Phycisphaerales bacterium]|nr:MAG: hypothetical protein JSW47_11010 [Phycisphaerales bacterium]
MKSVTEILAIIILLIGGCMSPQESSSRVGYDFTAVDKVAIVAVEGALKSEVAKDQIADFFSIELLEKGYAPIGRDQVRAQLREQEPEDQDLMTVEKAVDVGLILDVPVVLAIQIPHFGEEITMTAKMINVEDGSTLWLASESGRGKKAVSDMFSFSRGRRGDDSLLNNVMPGPPMSTGPNLLPLTPEEARKAQDIIKSMCKSLPAQITPAW